ncbi:MAG: acyl-CoA thioesterase [Microthrixaceae bacterium]
MKIDDLLEAFRLDALGDGLFRATSVDLGGPMVYGGQILGQSLLAAQSSDPAKAVKTIHTVFAKPASIDHPLELGCEVMHSGRALASVTVTASQGERLCARSIVLLSSDEPDFVTHRDQAPPLEVPETGQPPCGDRTLDERAPEDSAFDTRLVGDVDVNDPDQVGPASLDVWARCVDAPRDQPTNRALLAYLSDGFLIGTAMRPHEGLGQSQAHVSVATAVLSHTLTFHDDVAMGEWLLLSHASGHAGGGRSHGSAQVFDSSGRLVASYMQDAMIRAL